MRGVFLGQKIRSRFAGEADVEKTPKYPEMGLYRASYEVFKNEGELVLYCEHLQTVKYRNAEIARKNTEI